ncbi:hybrid sensor histidine kinase/response regulator transcription factor [Niabella ginsengisoli]|uniref:histidine kinase n=1 Tax=Niabella ginsengisoli TaxID=522298 RepID=A0ABS9SIY8_9BACT|nr:response regulator [Niabella ginsengisoli]MCH5598319.1 response regulator [Niabella ginsengisoli]
MSPVDKMMNDRANDSYLQQQFQNIKKNANNLLRLSEELMDFRKVETEHLMLHVAPYDIVSFIKEIYEHFTELSLARNIHISFTHDTSWQQLYFDKEQLEKVFFNLIGNAFKFTPDGGKIQVHIENGDDDVKVSVIDNGRGIAPEYKDKLFNNFFQIDDSGHQNKGYGIGLALSSKIATLHSAKIEVDSRIVDEQIQERKTTFAVLLKKGATHFNKQPGYIKPKITVDINKTEELHSLDALFATEPNVVETYMKERDLSILLVDDNPEIRRTIQEILSDKYNVILQEDASNGWEYATEHIPDLIISDVMMPLEDGLSFCNRLKSDLRTCHIPVILLTAKTTQQDHIKGLDKGADIYLTKPFNRRVLELNVRNLLATRERIRENVKHYIQEGMLQTPIVAEEQLPVANELDNEFLTDIINIIEKYLDDTAFNVSILAQKIGMSVPVLYRKTKAVTNLSVNDFIKSVKLQKAAELLLQKELAVYEVCYAVGYQDRKHFSLEFKKKFGKTPKQYAMSES